MCQTVNTESVLLEIRKCLTDLPIWRTYGRLPTNEFSYVPPWIEAAYGRLDDGNEMRCSSTRLFLGTLALLLSLAIGLWVSSGHHYFRKELVTPHCRADLTSFQGRAGIRFAITDWPELVRFDFCGDEIWDTGPIHLGIYESIPFPGVPQKYVVVAFSYWAVVSALSGCSLLILWSLRRRKHSIGCCASCGYDLRASAEGCPECGVKRSI